MILLALDPGLRRCGWAVFHDGLYHQAGLSRGEMKTSVKDVPAWIAVIEAIPDPWPDELICEYPQVYTSRMDAANDLLQLASVLGVAAHKWKDVKNTMVRPRQWKGQRPKAATEHQAKLVLDVYEKGNVERDLSLVSPSLRHNVWDAICIGLVHLRRMR